jgi:hypothetical protein
LFAPPIPREKKCLSSDHILFAQFFKCRSPVGLTNMHLQPEIFE